MKSRNNFTTEQEYYDYLLAYYAGQAMNGMLSDENNGNDGYVIAVNSIICAKELIEQLKKGFVVNIEKICDTCNLKYYNISNKTCRDCFCHFTRVNWQPK